MIIGQLLSTLSLESLFLRSIVLKCSSYIALIISLVLAVKSSMSSLELDLEIKEFKFWSDKVPGILSLQEFI